MKALDLHDVHKRFGAIQALGGVTLAIPKGVICGLIGPNGAGKTTTFGVVSGFVHPDSGAVNVLGVGPFQSSIHGGRVAVLPQDSELNPHLPVRSLLTYFGRLQGLSRHRARTDTERVLDLVGLRDRGGDRLRQLSHGMRRRVAIAQTLLGTPDLILLDEPTSGLDPHLVVRMRDVFIDQAKKSTLVISSHNLAELEATCNYIVFMEAGRIIRSGEISDITGSETTVRYRLEKEPPLDAIRTALPGGHVDWKDSELAVIAPQKMAVPDVNARVLPVLLDAAVGIREIRSGKSLEDGYLEDRHRTLGAH